MALKKKTVNSTIGDYSLNPDDIYLVFDSELDAKGLIDHHISSANELYEIGIPQIITQVFELNFRLEDIKRNTEEEKNINYLMVHVTFENVNINKPTIINYTSRKEEVLFPNVALLKEKTYKSTVRVDVKIKVTAIMKNGYDIVREDIVKNFKICKMPIMVKSKWCNTYNLSKETLTKMHEDPSDPGGYFIIRGVEWVIDCVENILYNKVRIFRNEGFKKEIMRAEFISKPGDFYLNSDQFIVRWLNDGQLTVEIKREKLKDIYIPFYLIFRIMGWNTDKQIFDNILYGYDNPTSKNMITYIKDAFASKYTHLSKGRYIYTQNEALQYIAEEIKDNSFSYLDVDNYPENYQNITNFILEHMDIHFMQHMGTNITSRDKKLRFLCVVIRKIFLVHLGNMEPTDRDSYNSKRINAAGTNYAKSFKTNFNASIVQQIRRKITKDFKAMSFNQIDLAAAIKSSVFGADFERSITQSITAGNKTQITVSNRVRVNRLSSQLLNRKNQLNVFSTLRQVTAITADSAKQSERASEMRRVHLSFLGYICVTHSPEGEKVGINKQLAMFSFVTKASFSEVIKDILYNDNEVFPLNSIDYADIQAKDLCNIYVNGDWIGCCLDAIQIVNKYRKMRRQLLLSPELTIVWDNTQDEVYFWTDVGRVIRPLLIVYNNHRDPEKFSEKERGKKFRQGLSLTGNHIDKLYAKTITFEDLLKEQVVEYISAEEQENMYLAANYDILKENQNNIINEYTHCDIPQAMLGITALTSPYAAHNQAQRIVYQTSQSKQTCGMFAKNWPYRADKDTFLQYNNEVPIVKTVSNRYLYPNGSNCIVAMMCNTGYNQEDSLIINQGAIDRGLFNGCKFTFYKTELEQREEFANPDITNTTDIKSACYDKLVNGIIKKGTVVNKNDAIIGKIMKISKNADENFQYTDRSIIYKEDEPCIVHNVIEDRNEEDERFVKVVMRKLRPVQVGDKFCFTGSHEILTTEGWKNITKVTLEDNVATLNRQTSEVEWQQPTELHEFDHKGDMYHVSNNNVELVSTLNHKMYCRDAFSRYDLKEAKDIIGDRVYFKRNGKNVQKDIDKFTIPLHNNTRNIIYPEIEVDMNAWLTFFGIYLAEGHIDNSKCVRISAHKERVKNKLNEILPILDFNFKNYDTESDYYIRGMQLSNYLSKFGKAINKSVPKWIFTLSKNQSKLLLDGMLLGDGCLNKGSWEYYSGSKSLAEAAQILAFNSEQSANLTIKNEKGEKVIIKGMETTRNSNQHRVFISNYHLNLEPLIGGKKTEEKIIEFDGKVYCITVPNGIFMVRYNNKYCWTSNSSRAG